MDHRVAVFGWGPASDGEIRAMLDEHNSAYPITHILVPGTEDHFSPPVRAVLQWSIDKSIQATVVTDDRSQAADLPDYAPIPVVVDDVVEAVMNTPTLLLAFEPDKFEWMGILIQEASARGHRVFDLVYRLAPLIVDDDYDWEAEPCDNVGTREVRLQSAEPHS